MDLQFDTSNTVKVTSSVAPATTMTAAITPSNTTTTKGNIAPTNATTRLTTTIGTTKRTTTKVATKRVLYWKKILPRTVLGNYLPYGTRRTTETVPSTNQTTSPTPVTSTSTTSTSTTTTVSTTTVSTTTVSTTKTSTTLSTTMTTTTTKPKTVSTTRKPSTSKTTTRWVTKTTTELTTFTVDDQMIDDFYFSKEYPSETASASNVIPFTRNSQDETGASPVPLTVWIEIADLGKDGSNQGKAFIVDGASGGKNGGKKGGKAPVGRRIPISVQAAPDTRPGPVRDTFLKNPFAEAPESSADANSEEVDLVEEETFVEQGGENRDGSEPIESDEHPAKWYDAYSMAQENVAMGQAADGKWYETDRS